VLVDVVDVVGVPGVDGGELLDGGGPPPIGAVSLPLPDAAPPTHTPFQAAIELGSDRIPVTDVSVVHKAPSKLAARQVDSSSQAA